MEEYTIVSSDGEVVRLPLGLVAPRRARLHKEFIMIFQDGLLAVANERLNGTELRVLLVILAWTDYQNRVGCTQSAIASRLGISPQQVCAAMSVLAKRALIYKTHVVDRGMTVWYVSPILAWRGTPQNHASAAAKAPLGIPV